MMEDVVDSLRELTDVDFERDSTKPESELSSLCSLLYQFIENEMRSCSMDLTLSRPLTLGNAKASFPLYSLNRGLGGITPKYVQRAWGGRVAIEDIEAAFEELKRSNDLLFIGK